MNQISSHDMLIMMLQLFYCFNHDKGGKAQKIFND